jgi:Helix-turn-helix domain
MSISLPTAPAGASSTVLPGRAFYSPKEVEAILGISHASLYRLIAAKQLDARKLNTKTLITAESIQRLIAELPKVGCAL